MRVMIDTNVIISAMLKANSIPDVVLSKACNDYELVLCDHIIYECYDVAKRRFPSKISTLDNLFAKLRYELVSSPRANIVEIRDVKDQPILNAAMAYEIDVLVTGDKHFLELTIDRPKILMPNEFMDRY